MIGVIVKPVQARAAEEFFQLFKTPWEMHREDRAYDVVVTSDDRIPGIVPKLLVVYGSETSCTDEVARRRHTAVRSKPVLLDYTGVELPIYGELVTFGPTGSSAPVITADTQIAGFRVDSRGCLTVRLGYDLFREVELLLSSGQPAEWAHVPTLEIHIRVLREAILAAGIPLLEIPPAPAGYAFQVCLTHDIDFAGIRFHKFDHSMWGFLYRSTVGGLRDLFRGRVSVGRLLRMWRAAASLPFVYLGLAKDFWLPFEWYLRVEKDLPITYFLIPFKYRPGAKLSVKHPERRATKYDISDIPQWTARLLSAGCEIGVHGIDSWHSSDKGLEEMGRVAAVTQTSEVGVRMHWLMQDQGTYRVLDEAGYAYDSTAGYNETVGYRCGTMQVFRPLDSTRLLELPLHIQDGALFYPQQLGLTEGEAWRVCEAMLQRAKDLGGVLTVLWHDRSHGPERFWGDFYIKLLDRLRASKVWFGSAKQVVQWFRQRRDVSFAEIASATGGTQLELSYHGERIEPPLTIRVYEPATIPERSVRPARVVDVPWAGDTPLRFTRLSDRFVTPPCDAVTSAVD